MNTGKKRSALSYIPGFSDNAVLRLIIFLSVAYVILWLTWGVIMLVYRDGNNFSQYFIPAIALPKLAELKNHWWTFLTYGIFNFPNGFWELISNMLWLYCFGSVVQMLVGPKQVAPLFFYSLVAGSVFYFLAQLLPGELGKCPPYILGPRAGLMGLAAAAVTLTPNYRFYLTETFRIHILVVAGVFTLLMIVSTGYYLPVIILVAGGGLMGFGYIRLLKSGYRPAEWIYSLARKTENLVTPDENAAWKKNSKKRNDILNKMYEPKHGITQKRIDDILDKINQKGYNALSSEEKDTLMRAGKE
jgi:membrane associated rhomboid family serine protease